MPKSTSDVGSLMQVLEACICRTCSCDPKSPEGQAVSRALAELSAGSRELVSLETRWGKVFAVRNCEGAVLVFPERALVARRDGKVALRGFPKGLAFEGEEVLVNEPIEALFSEGTFTAVAVTHLATPTRNGAARRHRAAIEAVKDALAVA